MCGHDIITIKDAEWGIPATIVQRGVLAILFDNIFSMCILPTHEMKNKFPRDTAVYDMSIAYYRLRIKLIPAALSITANITVQNVFVVSIKEVEYLNQTVF